MKGVERGRYAKWDGQWWYVLWAGRTRLGTDMAQLHTLPTTWPDRQVWAPLGEIEAVRTTRPRPPAPPKQSKLDDEMDRAMTRDV